MVKRRIPEETRKMILRDYKRGIAITIIAETHNVSAGYVSYVARTKGLNRYNKHRSKKKGPAKSNAEPIGQSDIREINRRAPTRKD